MQIEVEDIRRLNVSEGETLVMRFPRPATTGQADTVRDRIRENLPDGVRLLCIFGDVEMDVVAAGEHPAL